MSNPPLPASLFTSRANQPWKHDEPFPQPFYYFRQKRWIPASSGAEVARSAGAPSFEIPSQIRLITWNIDALVPFAEERMAGALEYLEQLHNLLRGRPAAGSRTGTGTDKDNATDDPTGPPLIIFLQEMLKSDLEQIREAEWVRNHFYVTDMTEEFWESKFYGTTTLVEKRLDVQRVFRVHYKESRMQRDGLFVDISVRGDDSQTSSSQPLRLCNTHLESLVSNPPRRPVQLRLASTFMHSSGPPSSSPSSRSPVPTPHASLLAGDLNAFSPEDLTAPIDCGLSDAFLVVGGKEGTDEGYTWGQQVPDELQRKFGCSRMDKILFCGRVKAEKLQRIGAGLTVRVRDVELSEEEEEYSPEEMEEEDVWVTDHLGLMGEFTVLGKGGKGF